MSSKADRGALRRAIGDEVSHGWTWLPAFVANPAVAAKAAMAESGSYRGGVGSSNDNIAARCRSHRKKNRVLRLGVRMLTDDVARRP
jgi:hypothetical protein